MSGRRDGLLDALCWCGATTVDVTPDAVRAGITGTCGRDGCNPTRTSTAVAPPPKPTRPRRPHGAKGRAQPTYRDVLRMVASIPPPTDPAPEVGPLGGHRPQPTGRDRERTARRLAGPPAEPDSAERIGVARDGTEFA